MTEIRVHATQEFSVAQSQHEHLPKLPTRMLIVAPSGAGKTVFLTSLFTDLYVTKSGASTFARIYIFSPSIHVDPVWGHLKSFQRNKMKVSKDEEDELYVQDFAESKLRAIVERQKGVSELAKQRKMKRLYNIAVVLDDVADDPQITRFCRTLHAMFTRHRHIQISTFCSLQSYRSVAAIIRKNATALVVFRLRSVPEREAIVEENSAVYDKDTMRLIYETATEEPHSFLYIDLMAKRREDMFWERFSHRLVPTASGAGASEEGEDE